MAGKPTILHGESYGGVTVIRSNLELSPEERRQRVGARIMAHYQPYYEHDAVALAEVEQLVEDKLGITSDK